MESTWDAGSRLVAAMDDGGATLEGAITAFRALVDQWEARFEAGVGSGDPVAAWTWCQVGHGRMMLRHLEDHRDPAIVPWELLTVDVHFESDLMEILTRAFERNDAMLRRFAVGALGELWQVPAPEALTASG